ncbi:hypothetical protein [Sphingomonas jatrophae]|uniref:Uncharacterized protein n=1 Tax=Sphingomonas jatrophae TaxID=1166337 RepID=A0A1I6KG80_9SPHN|nr:hypothetical protein [Sphingomonas jatrophae]SFR90239.1 hypothetical protein SAMN05192580_1708 [Sphingomonas jatrophae]
MESNEARYSTPNLPREARAIRLGTLLFTMVEPRPGHELAYNRWYERDHFYSGCMIGTYTLAGNRFVATRECKAKRFGTVERDLAKGSFLALYWILDGHHAEWDAWGVKQVNALHAEGRMFKERDHIHTGMYAYEAEYNAPGSTMPIELALDRPYGGVAAFIIAPADGKSRADIAAWLEGVDSPGDVALLASPVPLDPTRPADVPASEGNHVVLVAFSVEDPCAVWDERFAPFGLAIEAAGVGRIEFASPFKSVVFGTDTYVDQL